MGNHIVNFDEVTSTMDIGWLLANERKSHGNTFLAQYQTKGRGRFNRKWLSPVSESVMGSIIVKGSPNKIATLGMIGCVAIAKSIKAVADIECQLKWPNDVLVGGKKVSGILVESQISTNNNGVGVLGFGVNINNRHEGVSDFRIPPTSLFRETGEVFDINKFALTAIRKINLLWQGDIQSLNANYSSMLGIVGKNINVTVNGRLLTGTVRKVDKTGAIELVDPSGNPHLIVETDASISI